MSSSIIKNSGFQSIAYLNSRKDGSNDENLVQITSLKGERLSPGLYHRAAKAPFSC